MNEIFIKKSFKELMDEDICKYESVNAGLSIAEKFHVWTVEKQYLVKFTTETLNFENYEILKKMYDTGISVVAAIKWKYYPDSRLTILIYDWIPGKNLETILMNCNDEEKVCYGQKTAALMKSFHEFDVSSYNRKYSPYSLFRRYAFCLFRYRATYPHIKEVNSFIKNRKKIWINCNRSSLTHQDLRPENILVYNDKLYMIDFETAEIADPYSDFVFCISMQPDYQIPYSCALINAYFDTQIPGDFWLWTLFYGAMALQKYAIWKYRVKHKMVKLQANHFYDLYSGLTSEMPLFWREKKNDTKSDKKD